MQLLSGFTQDAHQVVSFTSPDGVKVTLTLHFRRQQIGWYYDFEYGTFVSRGLRLSAHPNALVQYRNILPVGLAVVTEKRYEPQTIDALYTGEATLYLLDADEIAAVQQDVDAT
jgi:hypothetical protein